MMDLIFAVFSIGWAQISAIVFAVFSFILFLLQKLKRRKRENEQQKSYIETRKRMDKVVRDTDADAARERLRARGKQ